MIFVDQVNHKYGKLSEKRKRKFENKEKLNKRLLGGPREVERRERAILTHD